MGGGGVLERFGGVAETDGLKLFILIDQLDDTLDKLLIGNEHGEDGLMVIAVKEDEVKYGANRLEQLKRVVQSLHAAAHCTKHGLSLVFQAGSPCLSHIEHGRHALWLNCQDLLGHLGQVSHEEAR